MEIVLKLFIGGGEGDGEEGVGMVFWFLWVVWVVWVLMIGFRREFKWRIDGIGFYEFFVYED